LYNTRDSEALLLWLFLRRRRRVTLQIAIGTHSITMKDARKSQTGLSSRNSLVISGMNKAHAKSRSGSSGITAKTASARSN